MKTRTTTRINLLFLVIGLCTIMMWISHSMMAHRSSATTTTTTTIANSRSSVHETIHPNNNNINTSAPFYIALKTFYTMINNTLDIEQSSNKFRDFVEKKHVVMEIPLSSSSNSGSSGSGTCNPNATEFTFESDRNCKEYLSNLHNIISIRPMSSVLSTGRTIKFRVQYKGKEEAVMKVSQTKFVLEPASEVCAYVLDRVVGFNRVPLVLWQPFPLDWLRATSTLFGTFYATWFHRFVVQNPSVSKLTFPCKKYNLHVLPGLEFEANPMCFNVSLQLFVNNVVDALESSVAPPPKMSTLTNPSRPIPDDIPWSQRSATFNASVLELTNMYLFDFMIANTDRGYGHNHFAFSHVPRYVYLDQGSSFYKRQHPDGNPFHNTTGYCRHSRMLLGKISSLVSTASTPTTVRPHRKSGGGGGSGGVSGPLIDAVRAGLPKGIQHLVAKNSLRSCQERLDYIWDHIQNCVALHGVHEVYFFP
eukprot:PhF_6_TR34142/c1_g1_i1/m.49867/K21958/FAM20C; extracellular serine/threonine protein kinase FAM20C